MSLGTLEIEFLANIARLKQDLDEVKSVMGKTQAHIEGAVGKVNSVLGALGLGLSLAGFGAWMKSAIDAGDAAKEFSQKTGVAVKDVAGLQLAFQQGNVSGEELGKSMAKLSKTMVEGNGAFKELGVQTRNSDGSLRDVKDVIYDVADATKAMADGAGKTALLQEIFGKSAAALIPTLNEGSDGLRAMAQMADKLGLTMSAETAEAADKFNDTMELVGASTQGIARQVMAELLPTMSNLAGTFLSSATEGDRLKDIAGALATGLKGLFSVGYGVAEVFSTLGKSIGGLGAAAVAFISGDFAEAKNIVSEMSSDIANDWSESGAKIQQIWSDTGNKTVEALAAVNAKSKESVSQTKEQKDAVKEADKAYGSFRDKLNSTRNELTLQISGGEKLTKTQQALVGLTANNTDEVKKLSAARRNELIVLATNNVELEKEAIKHEEARKATEKLTKEIINKNETLDNEIQKQIEANAKLKDGEAASGALEVAKLRETAATAQKNAVTAQEAQQDSALAAEYQKQADKLRELADLKEQGVHLQIAKDSATEWKKTTDSIENGLTDSLMRGFENGKTLGDSFADGLKSQFKTLILQPTIKAIASPVADMVGNLFSGKGGSGGSILGSLGSLFGSKSASGSGSGSGLLASLGAVSGMISSAAPYAAAIYASLQIGKAVSGEFSIGGGLGKIFQKGLFGAAGGLINRAFGMGEKKVKAQGVEATISGDSFDGQSYADWKQKGGWFRKDKKGTNYSALDSEVSDSLISSTHEIYSQVEAYAKVLGIPADSMRSVSYKMRVQLTDDDKQNEAVISEVFDGYRNSLASKFGAVLSPFTKAGEALADTMERLSDIESMSQGINDFGGVFSRIATLSIDARDQLVGFAGGIDALIGKTQSFVDAYYSDAEKFGVQSKQVVSSLKAIGVDPAQLQTRDQYRALVEKQNVDTESGRQVFAALLDIAPAFAGLTDYLSQNNLTLDQSAAQAPQTAILQSLFDQSKIDATAMVDQQVLANDNLMSIEDAVRSGNQSIVDALFASGGVVTEAIGRALAAGASSTARAVVAA